MTGISNFFTLLFVFLSWKIVASVERSNFDDMSNLSDKDTFYLKDGRLNHYIPDMGFVLNKLLKYDNSMRHPTDRDSTLSLSSRSKGAAYNSEDPLAVLATGFHGSRGKRPSYNDEIPVFANGFPANRGRK